jgi:hypothetical protein
MKEKYMKKDSNKKNRINDDLLPEYDFSLARRNPYSSKNRVFVELTPEVAKVYKTSKEVNRTLKAIISTFPKDYIDFKMSKPGD